MRHYPKIFFFLLFLVLSCSKNDKECGTVDNCNTIGRTVFFISNDKPLSFLPSVDLDAWGAIESIEDRLAVCEVPQSILSQMTTDALALTIAQYPLNYLVFAYNDPNQAVRFLIENSSIHKEFVRREDNTHHLIGILTRSTMQFESRTDVGEQSPTISYGDEMMLEYLLSSKEVSAKIKDEDRSVLSDMILEKAVERLSDTVHYSSQSIEPLKSIDAAVDLGIVHLADPITKSGEFVGYVTLSTPLGKSIQGLVRNELTNTELIDITNLAAENYPNAIIRGSATVKYNCHSYAWHDDSTDNQYWINFKDNNGTFQLSNYWTNDVYVSTDEATANRAYYASGDHSAVILSNGNYLSKWGAYPLMEHSKEYCPYSTQDMQYFKYRTTPCYTLSASGPSPVALNQLNSYNVTSNLPKLEYSWEVRYMDAPEPKPFDLYENNGQCTLVCKEYGLFKLYVYGQYKGNTVASGQYNVVATP